MIPIVAYSILCVIVAILGRNRTIGFWGFLILSVVVSPFVTLVILMIGKERRLPRKVRKAMADFLKTGKKVPSA